MEGYQGTPDYPVTVEIALRPRCITERISVNETDDI